MHRAERSIELKSLVGQPKKELLFKIVVIGDFGVGKTSIIQRYCEGKYTSEYKITIGADFAIKTIPWDDSTHLTIQLWDVAGHERFGAFTTVYYRYAVAGIVVFDLTRPETYNSIGKWLKDLREKLGPLTKRPVPIIILANKGDVNISNLPPDIPEFCKKNDIPGWFITSAKDNTNIDEAMYFLTREIIQNFEYEQKNTHNKDAVSESIVLNNTQHKKMKKNCCNM